MAYFTDAQKKQQQLNKWGTGPTKMVRPMLPNSYDASEKARWGTDKYGQSQIPIDRYRENNRKMYALEDVPVTARAVGNGWMAPNLKESVDIARRYGGQGQAFATASQGLRGAWRMPVVSEAMQGPPMPIAEQFGPPVPTGDAWQRNLLGSSSALAARRETAAERWTGFGKTMLDQGGGNSLTTGSRATPTAPGASARVALRREGRRSQYPEDRQFGSRIGGFRNTQSNFSWAP